jgi:hypothetical protein
MRLLRFLLLGLVLIAAVCGLAARYAITNQTKLVQLALSEISEGTGFNVLVGSTKVSFRRHLVVVLQHPIILAGQRELMRLDAIRVIITYHSLLHSNGLPLYTIVLDHPDVHIPSAAIQAAAGGIPRIDAQAIATLKRGLDVLQGISSRVEVSDATVTNESGILLVDNVNATARQKHRRPGRWPWLLSFDAVWRQAPFGGARLAGNLWLGGLSDTSAATEALAAGRVWFSGLDLKNLETTDWSLEGHAQGSLRFALNSLGDLNGNAGIETHQTVIRGKALTRPTALGDLQLYTNYRASTAEVRLTGLSLQHTGERLLDGTAIIARPYDSIRTFTMSVGGIKLSLAGVAAWLHSVRGIPAAAIALLDRVDAGELSISQASLDTGLPLRDWTAATVRDSLGVEAAVSGGGFVPPEELKIPSISRVEAGISYAGAVIRLTQGSAKIGNSTVDAASLHADLRKAPDHLPYAAKFAGDLDVSELYPAAAAILRRVQPRALAKIEGVSGHVPVDLNFVGDLRALALTNPERYRARFDLKNLQASIKGAPSAIALQSGTATLQPQGLQIDQVVAIFVGQQGGKVVLNGRLDTRPVFPTPRQFSVELRSIPSDQWLPLLFDPDDLSAKGPIAGHLQIDADLANVNKPIITGKLSLGPGEVQLGFLRSPIMTDSATLLLDGKGMEVSMPSSRIEGSPIQLKFTVPELARPTLRIDAAAENLDFEVMSFIRLPWSRATPPHFFPVPVTGHITSRVGNFDKLVMSDVASNFSHDSTDWHVSNFTARAFGGRIDLDIVGRARDDWIHVKGTMAGMSAQPLTQMMEPGGQPALNGGQLYARADLWANTDVNFFDTLAGTATLEVRDGTLNRFVLLTRILSFIDLRSWITAQSPNPLVAGLPFKSLIGDFKGKDGDFYTDNLKLDGPVMSVTARGDVKLGSGTLNLRIGLIPFTTVNWIVSKIPLMGENIANGSSGLLAAYFQVRGPVGNPTVIPKPITSVANFVIKTLSLPINIIKPNTIR